MFSSTGTTMAALCVAVVAAIGGVVAGQAEAAPIADRTREVTTADGWQLSIEKVAEALERVPNLADSPFSREGFVSLTAVAEVSGHGAEPVNSGSLTLGYQLGCQVDFSSGVGLGLSAAIGPNVGVTVGTGAGINAGMSALALPNVSITLKPGTITTIPFGTKPLASGHGSISMDRVEIKTDACLGQVTLRSYAAVTISTVSANNSVSVYGDPIVL